MEKKDKEIEEIKKFFENQKLMHVTFKKNLVTYNDKKNCFEVKYNYTFDKKACYKYQEAKDMMVFDNQVNKGESEK